MATKAGTLTVDVLPDFTLLKEAIDTIGMLSHDLQEWEWYGKSICARVKREGGKPSHSPICPTEAEFKLTNQRRLRAIETRKKLEKLLDDLQEKT